MEIKVLVAYASKYGATAEIAGKIGEVLAQNNLQADVLPVKKINDLAPYQAVVLGSAAYMGQWRKEAVKFLGNNEKSLSELSVWLFSSGPVGEGDPVQLLEGWKYPGKIGPAIDRIKPRDIAIFHGVVDMEKLNFLERKMMKTFKSPEGDFRDWDAISAWAKSIADELKKKAGE